MGIVQTEEKQYNVLVPRHESIRKGLTFERMYKLLLVTDNEQVIAAFKGITSWSLLGYKEPRIASDIETAFDTLSRHHADGIFIALRDGGNGRFIERMNERPLTPIIIEHEDTTTSQVTRDLEQLSQVLNRTHADYSNDRYSEGEMMQLCRHEYFRRLLSGAEKSEENAMRTMLMLRSRMDPKAPCIIMELIMPEDEGYLQGKWAYGADRLEVAMRNIFGAEKDGMRVLISVIDEQRMFLVACPMIGQKQAVDTDTMLSLVREHAAAGIEHVRDFLGIDLHIASEEIRPSLMSFTYKGV